MLISTFPKCAFYLNWYQVCCRNAANPPEICDTAFPSTARRKMDLKPDISPSPASVSCQWVSPLPFCVILLSSSHYIATTLALLCNELSRTVLWACCFPSSQRLNFFASHYPSAVSLIHHLSSFSSLVTLILFDVWFADSVSFLFLCFWLTVLLYVSTVHFL